MLVKDNPYISVEDRDFFILLRVGLWQTVSEKLSNNPDWNYIYTLSLEQTVHGIIADGLALYLKQYPDLKITEEENEKFLSALGNIIQRNYSVNKLQTRICKLFEQNKITYVILKGQTVGQCYFKPMLRCSGDIDFLVPSEECDDYQRANDLMVEISKKTNYYLDYQKQQKYYFGEIPVEIHGRALSLISKKLDNVVEGERKEMFKHCNFTEIADGINAPNLEYHAFFIYCHILKHIFENGIGLRQLCDLTMFMTKNKDKINLCHLGELIENSETQRWWNMISRFISIFISPDYVDPCYRKVSFDLPNSYSRTIWKNCKKSGNFGHKDQDEAERASGEFLSRNLYSFRQAHSRFYKLLYLYPVLAFSTLFRFYGMYIGWGLKKTFHIKGYSFNS